MHQLKTNSNLQGGKYIIERVLGQGGFGNTYVGVNTVFNDTVAIKEFFMQGINDRDESTGSITINIEQNRQQFIEQLEKFKKEALRIRKLNNEHIVRVHDLFEENGTAYYVMDFIDGESLSERLKRTGKPMTEEEVRVLLPQILDALKTVHNTGIWHLDLKPANIMLTKEGQVKLIDFGASKQLNAKKGGATTSTAISYTNGYAPREQMEQNYDKFGPWTDIYALGATIYTLLTNKRPPLPTTIDDDTSEDKHFALPLPDGISKDIKNLVLAMLHTNKNQRPQNVEAIMAALSQINEGDDALSEETIIDPKRNGAKEEQKQDLINNEKTQIDTLNKGVEKKSKTKKQIKTRVLLSLAIIFILGCIGWIIYHNSNEKKSLYQVNNDSDQSSIIVHDIKGNQDKVFKALKNKGYTGIGNNEVEFGKLMNDSTNRRKVYDALVQEGYKGIGKDYDEFEKLIYQAENDNKRKLYNALSADYDLGSFEQFSKDIQDQAKRQKLYNAIKDEYDLPDFDGFSEQLGVKNSTATTPQGQIQKKKNKEFNKEDRKWFYNVMKAKGIDTGSYDDFIECLNNKEDREWYYKKAIDFGLDVGSQTDFDNMMWVQAQQAPKHSSHDSKRTNKSNDRTQSSIYKSKKLNELFDNIRVKGFAKDKTREEFFNYMLAPGKQGYKNRKDFFDDYKGHGLTDLNSYEEFVKWLGLRPVKSVLKYQFFDKDGKSHTIDKSEYDTYSDDFAKQHPDISMRMVAPDGKSRMVPIANVKAAITKDGYRMWLMKVGSISSKKHIQLKTVSQDNIHLLYNELKDSYELGSENDFRKYLSDPRKREKLRKELEAEYDVGDFESFSKYLGFETSK